MKTKRVKSRTQSVPIVPRKLKPEVVPQPIAVFEGTIDGHKYLIDASPWAPSLNKLAEITGTSPKDYADKHNMRIVPRSQANPEVVKALKKAWNVAKAYEYETLTAQAKAKRANARIIKSATKIGKRKH